MSHRPRSTFPFLAPIGLLLLAALGAALGAAPGAAQNDCAGGVINDDGTFENGLSALPSAPSAEYVMRVTPPPGFQRLDKKRMNALASSLQNGWKRRRIYG